MIAVSFSLILVSCFEAFLSSIPVTKEVAIASVVAPIASIAVFTIVVMRENREFEKFRRENELIFEKWRRDNEERELTIDKINRETDELRKENEERELRINKIKRETDEIGESSKKSLDSSKKVLESSSKALRPPEESAAKSDKILESNALQLPELSEERLERTQKSEVVLDERYDPLDEGTESSLDDSTHSEASWESLDEAYFEASYKRMAAREEEMKAQDERMKARDERRKALDEECRASTKAIKESTKALKEFAKDLEERVTVIEEGAKAYQEKMGSYHKEVKIGFYAAVQLFSELSEEKLERTERFEVLNEGNESLDERMESTDERMDLEALEDETMFLEALDERMEVLDRRARVNKMAQCDAVMDRVQTQLEEFNDLLSAIGKKAVD